MGRNRHRTSPALIIIHVLCKPHILPKLRILKPILKIQWNPIDCSKMSRETDIRTDKLNHAITSPSLQIWVLLSFTTKEVPIK